MIPSRLRRLTVTGMGALLALTLPAATGGNANGPSLRCDAPVFDFGTRFNTEDIFHVFTLTNCGVAPLVISQVRTGCGCTRAELDRNTIPPGGIAALTSTLTLRGYSGLKHSSIYLHTNDPDNPVFLCQYQGVALAELDISPPAVRFDITPDSSSNQTATLTILNRTAIPLHPLSLDSPGPFCSLQLATNQPGRQYTLTVNRIASPATESVMGIITLLTDHPRYSKIEIPFSLAVIKDLAVYPEELAMKEGSPASLLESRYIIIQRRDNQPFSVRKVEVIPPVIAVNIHSAKPSWTRLKAGPIRPTKAMNGTVIRVYTDLPRQPVIDIPVKVTGP